MGHDIIRCDFCGTDVMEGRNDWKCDCGAICDESTKYIWIKKEITNNKKNDKIKFIKLKPDLIL